MTVPNFGEFGDVRVLADLALAAEAAGWDGFFVWDHIHIDANLRAPMVDPWIALTAVALATERIRIGPMVTPLARRRPSKVARETVTLDRLSNGRLILGAGLGYPPEGEFAAFGEDADERVRAEKLDEALDIITGLWSGEPFSHDGKHYRVRNVVFAPAPVQQPRIPIWLAAMWPNRGPVRRAARWDGVFPIMTGSAGVEMLTPEELADVAAYAAKHRTSKARFDIVVHGWTPVDDPAAARVTVEARRDAGATWWLEDGIGHGGVAGARERLSAGPPRR
jgi:alkanesulfonate monooxygenase SsuD/methylene tetrahydromethanopterin reductase-like flavin-dependent oxidoreductase (luciferase family)